MSSCRVQFRDTQNPIGSFNPYKLVSQLGEMVGLTKFP
jgi:hypothetical protein